ncbi:2769_t:CDS:2, partial [Paraglomus brasilianum]
HQICLLSENDVENFVWSTEEQTRSGRSIDITLMRSQNQQRGVSIGDGFEIHIPELSTCNQDSSKVYIIESTTSQTLAIMQPTDKSSLSTQTKTFTSSRDFQQFWRQHLNNNSHALRFNKLSIDELIILIKDGLNKPELLHEYEDRMKKLNDETN